jgi:hypothetical protein
MGGQTGVGAIGELPDMPGVEGYAEVDLRPPSFRTELEVRTVQTACLSCDERDSRGARLLTFHPGGGITCGKYKGGQCGKDSGDGMGCCLNWAWLLKSKHCDRGKW